MNVPLQIDKGNRLILKKKHPCGGDEWIVDRVGADIGIVCKTCGRRVLLDRVVLEKRIRKIYREGLKIR